MNFDDHGQVGWISAGACDSACAYALQDRQKLRLERIGVGAGGRERASSAWRSSHPPCRCRRNCCRRRRCRPTGWSRAAWWWYADAGVRRRGRQRGRRAPQPAAAIARRSDLRRERATCDMGLLRRLRTNPDVPVLPVTRRNATRCGTCHICGSAYSRKLAAGASRYRPRASPPPRCGPRAPSRAASIAAGRRPGDRPAELFISISTSTLPSPPPRITTASIAAADSEWIETRPLSKGIRERPFAMSSASATRTIPASSDSGWPPERCAMIVCSTSAMTTVRSGSS